ncbi:MAG: aminoacyl-tRNA hydrolase [Pseudomonadota bacterium]
MKSLPCFQNRSFIVVGVGNPGVKYASHRHNAGFMTVDSLAEELGGIWSLSKHDALTCSTIYSGNELFLVKPQTYMNLSGKAVQKIVSFKKSDMVPLIVIHDELDIKFGRVRIKIGGGDGGHRGVRSITDSIRFRDFTRVRIGIGRPPAGVDPEEFVLRSFTPPERPVARRLVQLAAEATKLIVCYGTEHAKSIIHSRENDFSNHDFSE